MSRLPITTLDQLHALQARLHRHDVPFSNGHVAWRSLGSGPPLVLLHGGHGSWAHWAQNIEALAQHHTVWVVDMPGYGDSTRSPAPTLAALAEALHETWAALSAGAGPLSLAGFSFGGLVAAQLALQMQNGATAPAVTVRALALMGPGGHGSTRRPRGELLPWREAAANHDEAALRNVMRHNLQLHMLAGPVDGVALEIHTRSALRTRFHSRSIALAGGLGERLRAQQCPVLLTWGEHDVTATPDIALQTMAAECRQAQTCKVPGAGHWVQYESADTINPMLAAWLQDPRPSLL